MVAISAVLVAHAFTPRGVCGTAHSFLLSAVFGILWDLVEDLLPLAVARATFAFLNTAIFSALALLLHRRRRTLRSFYPLMLALAAAGYIYSYLFWMPTQDCP